MNKCVHFALTGASSLRIRWICSSNCHGVYTVSQDRESTIFISSSITDGNIEQGQAGQGQFMTTGFLCTYYAFLSYFNS